MTDMLAHWRITGQVGNHRGMGEMVIYALTGSPTILPDPARALVEAGCDARWIRISTVELLRCVPWAWRHGQHPTFGTIEPLVTPAPGAPKLLPPAMGEG